MFANSSSETFFSTQSDHKIRLKRTNSAFDCVLRLKEWFGIECAVSSTLVSNTHLISN